MPEGWIKLHRQLLENPVIVKDADHLAIWTWLLLNATHDEYDVLFDGRRMKLQPGQLITSRTTISGVLRVDDSKVDRVLNSFKNEQQIEQQMTRSNRLITVLNWKRYQQSEQPIEPPVSHGRATSEPPVSTNKNVKNVKMKELHVQGLENLDEMAKVILATLEFKGYVVNDNFPAWVSEVQKDFAGIDLREVCIAYKNFTRPYKNHLNAFRNFCRQEKKKTLSPPPHAKTFSAAGGRYLPDRTPAGHVSQHGESDMVV